MPVLSTILGVGLAAASAGAGISGAVSAHGQEKTQQDALKDQNAIAQQEMQDKQKAFQQQEDFYTPYLSEGSPFLKMIQAAAAAASAKTSNDAVGQIRSTMGQSGLGYGPSGSTGAAISNLGAQTAQTASTNWLSNLLNNEQIKFQAAKGINDAGSMAGSNQNQPSVSAQLPAASTASSIGALGSTLKGIAGNSAPADNSNVFGIPTVEGWVGTGS